MAKQVVSSGAVSGFQVVSSGDTLEILSGGVAAFTNVLSGGMELVDGGAFASATVVNGGMELIQTGATAIGTIVNAGAEIVGSGGRRAAQS